MYLLKSCVVSQFSKKKKPHKKWKTTGEVVRILLAVRSHSASKWRPYSSSRGGNAASMTSRHHHSQPSNVAVWIQLTETGERASGGLSRFFGSDSEREGAEEGRLRDTGVMRKKKKGGERERGRWSSEKEVDKKHTGSGAELLCQWRRSWMPVGGSAFSTIDPQLSQDP